MKVPFLDLKLQYQALKEEIEPELLKVFESCAFIGGSYVKNFEAEFASYLGVKHAVGCSSGTAALTLALRAAGVRSGDEVITTPFTFFATAEAIAGVGAVPVFVDVRQDDYNIDPDQIENAITEKTKAILPVHIFGAPCEMDRICEIAERYSLRVIEDDAQAAGSSYKGRKAGSIGDIGCFSFYPTKNLGGCGDGGMVTSNDEDLSVILLALREHGAGKMGAEAYELLKRSGALGSGIEGAGIEGKASEGTGERGAESGNLSSIGEKATDLYDPYKYYNYLIGYNSRLDAVQAACLSVKLRHLTEFNQKRAEIAKRYLEGLTDQVRRPVYDEKIITPCWHQFVIRSAYKAELCQALAEAEIGSGTFYPVPLHKQKAFGAGNCRIVPDSLPVAEEISSQSVCLPIFPEMTMEQVDYVIETVNCFYKGKG